MTRGRCARRIQMGAKSAEGRNRTGDTMIFSHVLYRLSYLGTSRYSSHLRQPPSQGHVHSEYGCCLAAGLRGYNRRKEGPVI